VNEEQLVSFEKLHNYFIAEELESSLVNSLEIIQNAALGNDNLLYSDEVKRFDSQWNALSEEYRVEIKAALNL
jgi:hypothetical protein